MRIDLTPRLRMVGKLIPAGVRLTDVGTDHAYLPAALIGEGKIPSAIAADLRQGPLARAKETVRQAGLTGKVAFRLCDGLSGIRPDETDAVAIAGMGGETIAAILSAALWTRERGMPLILQPMSSMPELRGCLQANGFCIEEERLAKEGDTLCLRRSFGRGKITVTLCGGSGWICGSPGRAGPWRAWPGAGGRRSSPGGGRWRRSGRALPK